MTPSLMQIILLRSQIRGILKRTDYYKVLAAVGDIAFGCNIMLTPNELFSSRARSFRSSDADRSEHGRGGLKRRTKHVLFDAGIIEAFGRYGRLQ